MTKVGRNAPCPCGSGKKYKRCCWNRDQTAAAEAAREQMNRPPPALNFPHGPPRWDDEYDDDGLTDLSNRVIDLLNAGDYEAAEAGCLELKEKFPEVVDWLDRTAMLHEAKGETDLALDYYQRCLDFIAQSPGNHEMGHVYEDAITRLRNDPTSKPRWLGIKTRS